MKTGGNLKSGGRCCRCDAGIEDLGEKGGERNLKIGLISPFIATRLREAQVPKELWNLLPVRQKIPIFIQIVRPHSGGKRADWPDRVRQWRARRKCHFGSVARGHRGEHISAVSDAPP